MKFDNLLNYCQTQSHPTFVWLSICLQFVENLVQPFTLNAGAGVLNPTLHDVTYLTCANRDLSIRRELDRVGNQILKDLAQQTSIGKDRHIGGNVIYYSGVYIARDRI